MSTRNRDLAIIHMAKKQLGWDEETYRDVLEMRTGKSSSGKLTAKERSDFIDHLSSFGFKVQRKPFRKLNSAEQRKALALWMEIKNRGYLNNSQASLESLFPKLGIQTAKLEWLTGAEVRKLIEALKSWIEREEKKGN